MAGCVVRGEGEDVERVKAVGFGCFPLIFVEMSGRGEK